MRLAQKLLFWRSKRANNQHKSFMADLSKIIEDLSKLTVVEAADLSKQLEKKWGVTAATTVAAAPVGVEAVAKEMECEIYLKFAINQNGKLLLMVSCHPST